MAPNLTKAEQLTEELKIAKRHAAQLGALTKEARDRVRGLINELLMEAGPAENGADMRLPAESPPF